MRYLTLGEVLNLLFPGSQVRSSSWGFYTEQRFHFVITIAGAVIAALAAMVILAYRDWRRRSGTS